MSTPVAEPDGGALSVPAADGYHYADDHPWGAADQAALTDELWQTVDEFRSSSEDAPSYSAGAIAEA
jgi:hypothetical protein